MSSETRLDELLLNAIKRNLGLTALKCQKDEFSYARLADVSEILASELKALGCKDGDPIVFETSNSSIDVCLQLGIWRAKCVAVPVQVGMAEQKRTELLLRVGATLYIATKLDAKNFKPSYEIRKNSLIPKRMHAELNSDQALIVFSSGSTGIPKGILLSHKALIGKLKSIQSVLPFNEGDVLLQTLKLNFSFGQWTTLLTLITGGTIELVGNFSTSLILKKIVENHYDRIPVVPSMLRMLIKATNEKKDLKNMLAKTLSGRPNPVLWIAGGEVLPSNTGLRTLDIFPSCKIADVYGLSETATSDLILGPDEYPSQAGSIGKPTPGVTIKIVDSEGHECPNGEIGELWINTPYMMSGYLGEAEKTKNSMEQGWFKTGDLIRIDRSSKLLTLSGRKTNIINRGGIKVSPVELEELFSQNSNILECVVIGLSDPIIGEAVILLLVCQDNQSFSKKDLMQWAKPLLGSAPYPDKVILIDTLPLGGTGKVDRLKAEELARLKMAQI